MRIIPSWTPRDILRPQTIGTGWVPSPASLISFPEVTGFAEVAVRARGEMKSPYFTAKAHILLGHPDFRQGQFVYVPQNIATHLLFSAVHGKVTVILR
jgi:hypothetical protein